MLWNGGVAGVLEDLYRSVSERGKRFDLYTASKQLQTRSQLVRFVEKSRMYSTIGIISAGSVASLSASSSS